MLICVYGVPYSFETLDFSSNSFLSLLQITSSLLICLQLCWFFCQLLVFTAELLQWIVEFGFVFFYLVLFSNVYFFIDRLYLKRHCHDSFISLSMVSFFSLSIILVASLRSLVAESTIWASSNADLAACLFSPRIWVTVAFFFTSLIILGWKLDILDTIRQQLWIPIPTPGIVVLFAYLFVYLFGDLALVVPAWSKVSDGEVCTQSWIRRVCKRVSQRLIILTKI